jgi:hypothetical protein
VLLCPNRFSHVAAGSGQLELDTVEVRSSSLLVPTILFYCLPGIPAFALAQVQPNFPSLAQVQFTTAVPGNHPYSSSMRVPVASRFQGACLWCNLRDCLQGICTPRLARLNRSCFVFGHNWSECITHFSREPRECRSVVFQRKVLPIAMVGINNILEPSLTQRSRQLSVRLRLVPEPS